MSNPSNYQYQYEIPFQNRNWTHDPAQSRHDAHNKHKNNKLFKKISKALLNTLHQTKFKYFLLLTILVIFFMMFVVYEEKSLSPKSTIKQKVAPKRQTELSEIAQIEVKPEIVPSPDVHQNLKKRNELRRSEIIKSFVHAYGGYMKNAFGYDELRPVSNETNSSWGGFGVTMFDALDTLVLMLMHDTTSEHIAQLQDMYEQTRTWIEGVSFDKNYDASFFESSIRYLGGMLGAFELTKDKMYLSKAVDIADRLVYAFETPTGVAHSIVNLQQHTSRNPSWTRGSSILAEAASVQLEFMYLSHHTQNGMYADKAHKVIQLLSQAESTDGLFPVYIDPVTGKFTNVLVSFGGLGDSFYEILLKQYLLSNKQNDMFKDMYLAAMTGMNNLLIFPPVTDSQNVSGRFLGEYDVSRRELIPEMDHLVCYVPGMLSLGSASGVAGELSNLHMKIAEDLLQSCFRLYDESPSGLAAERIKFDTTPADSQVNQVPYKAVGYTYLLRPETIESIFMLYRITHDEKYRDWGWNIFESIERHCKTPLAYSGIKDVTKEQPLQNNSMQSFFFAETLKYLYLLFSDDSVVDLNKYVFTTEAHPLGILCERQYKRCD
eukprot:CAMPEP_0168557680 /NCGR_PEP_ID=MMETSP0413-20121227/9556_1 /TAXON_ID=136452 /ORGANISM="Filamoeba nolandi, Strain NC-AS-23-1" /LENGTH=602 /DNA_ID=CAMNT_0008588731 /DNA_START=65 /DNA_END=1873 /DNA_ORIENTATION=-